MDMSQQSAVTVLTVFKGPVLFKTAVQSTLKNGRLGTSYGV